MSARCRPYLTAIRSRAKTAGRERPGPLEARVILLQFASQHLCPHRQRRGTVGAGPERLHSLPQCGGEARPAPDLGLQRAGMGRAYSQLDRRWHYCAMSLSRIRLSRWLRSWATSKPRARHEPLQDRHVRCAA